MNRRGFIGSIVAAVCALFLPKKLLASSEKGQSLTRQAQSRLTRHYLTLMQQYDKGNISAKTLLEELGLDYEEEVRRMRSVQ